jgi:hypothetical protein
MVLEIEWDEKTIVSIRFPIPGIIERQTTLPFYYIRSPSFEKKSCGNVKRKRYLTLNVPGTAIMMLPFVFPAHSTPRAMYLEL